MTTPGVDSNGSVKIRIRDIGVIVASTSAVIVLLLGLAAAAGLTPAASAIHERRLANIEADLKLLINAAEEAKAERRRLQLEFEGHKFYAHPDTDRRLKSLEKIHGKD